MSVSFPTYAKVLAGTLQASPGKIMQRTDMGRGVAKQRRLQSDVMVTVSFTVLFESKDRKSVV